MGREVRGEEERGEDGKETGQVVIVGRWGLGGGGGGNRVTSQGLGGCGESAEH